MQGGEEERSHAKWKNGLVPHGMRGNYRAVEEQACSCGDPGGCSAAWSPAGHGAGSYRKASVGVLGRMRCGGEACVQHSLVPVLFLKGLVSCRQSAGKNTPRQMETQAKNQTPDSQTAPDRSVRLVAMASPVVAGAAPWRDAGWPLAMGVMPEPCRRAAAFLWNTGKSTNSGFEVPGGGVGSSAFSKNHLVLTHPNSNSHIRCTDQQSLGKCLCPSCGPQSI